MIRLHLTDDLAAGARVAPSPDQARYLAQVMRLKTGDELRLFNGRDGEWRARVAEVSKKGCVLAVEDRTREQAGVPDLELVVALVKRARLETIVEKAAELGCRRVRLMITRRTQADHTRVERLQAIAVEASEQTGRLDVPEVVAPEKLERILDAWPAGRRLMFCDEGLASPSPAGGGWPERSGGRVGAASGAPPTPPALRAADPPPVGEGEACGWSILIGPEGGFAPEERARLASMPQVTPVSLGPRILRADTAAIAALALWQASRGDWR